MTNKKKIMDQNDNSTCNFILDRTVAKWEGKKNCKFIIWILGEEKKKERETCPN